MAKLDKINKRIAKHMLKQREKAILSRGKVSKATGLHINTIKNIEEAKSGMNVKTLKLLCDCYGTSLAKMFKKIKV